MFSHLTFSSICKTYQWNLNNFFGIRNHFHKQVRCKINFTYKHIFQTIKICLQCSQKFLQTILCLIVHDKLKISFILKCIQTLTCEGIQLEFNYDMDFRSFRKQTQQYIIRLRLHISCDHAINRFITTGCQYGGIKITFPRGNQIKIKLEEVCTTILEQERQTVLGGLCI